MDYFWYCYLFLIGSIVGSFLNVCICRIPTKESVVTGRSHCPVCGHPLSFTEMVPIFSYLFLKGKCKCCHTPISPQYPLVEAVTAILYLLATLRFGFTPYTALLCVFFSVLIVAAGIDYHTMEIPDILHLWILLAAVIHLFLSPTFRTEALIGMFLISVPMLVLSLFTNGFGGGDIKLSAVCGLFLGFKLLLVGFLFACITAAFAGAIMLIRKKADQKTAFAFGPFLALGFIFSALYGAPLLNAYLSFF